MEEKGEPRESMRVESIFPEIEDIAQKSAYLHIFVEVASLRTKYGESVNIEMIDVNDNERRVRWLQHVAEFLQILPEEGILTTSMFFSAIRETEEHLHFDRIACDEMERKVKLDRSIDEMREDDKLLITKLREEDEKNLKILVKQAQKEEVHSPRGAGQTLATTLKENYQHPTIRFQNSSCRIHTLIFISTLPTCQEKIQGRISSTCTTQGETQLSSFFQPH